MRLFQRCNHVPDPLLRADHFQFPFRDMFHTSLRTDKRVRSIQRAELSAPADLKTAAVVIADRTGARGEHRIFHDSGMGFRNININSSVFHGVKISLSGKKGIFLKEYTLKRHF